jgi:hypothetical protein
VASAGLTSPIQNQVIPPQVVQPAEPSTVNAYGTGDGLEVGLVTPSQSQIDANQILLGGKAQHVAPPNTAATTTHLINIGTGSTAALAPLVQASALNGLASAAYSSAQCPIGEPISLGQGDAANANALSALGGAGGPVVNTAGTGTATAQSTSQTYLAPNGDGTWGLSTSASNIIAPINVNGLNLATVTLSVQSAGGVSDPVTLTTHTSGEGTGYSPPTLSTDDLLTASLKIGGTTIPLLPSAIPLSSIGASGLHITLNTENLAIPISALVAALNGVAGTLPAPLGPTLTTILSNPALSTLFGLTGNTNSTLAKALGLNLTLGTIDVDTTPTPIPGQNVNGGIDQAGQIDLLHVHLGLSGSLITAIPIPSSIAAVSLADLHVGHLEVASHTSAPIICSIPVIKVADPTSVMAGHSFTYTINVPNPAELQFLDCSLADMTVTDTIGDKPGSTSTFQVNSAQMEQANSSGQLVPLNVPATITQPDANHATVTWTGLNWNLGTPPLTGVINVTVPPSSPAGTIQDTVNATATLTGCHGITSISNTTLTGSYTLTQPGVNAVSPGQAATTVPGTPTTKPPSLPFTGAIGGPWQPIGGLAALGLGAGAFALLRRARRWIT